MNKAVAFCKNGMPLWTNWFGGNERMPPAEVERILELTSLLRTQAAAGTRLPGFASSSIGDVSFRS